MKCNDVRCMKRFGVHRKICAQNVYTFDACVRHKTIFQSKNTLKMIHTVKLEEAQEILEHRVPPMEEALDKAVEAWNVDLSHRHDVLCSLTRSMFISGIWHDEVMQALIDDPGIRLYENEQRQCLIFDDRVAVRLKLLDDKDRPRNSKTKRGRAWHRQLNLPGLPPVVRLDLGYRLDPIGSYVELAMLMCCTGDIVIWRWPIQSRQDDEPANGVESVEQRPLGFPETNLAGAQIR